MSSLINIIYFKDSSLDYTLIDQSQIFKSKITFNKACDIYHEIGEYDFYHYCISCTKNIKDCKGYANRYHGIQCFQEGLNINEVEKSYVFGICDQCYESEYDNFENKYNYIYFSDNNKNYSIDSIYRMND